MAATPTMKIAVEAAKQYKEIFTTYDDFVKFCSDFSLLVRVCIAERDENPFDAAGRDFVKNRSLNRETTKKYDAKAQADGRPTLLMLAMEAAKDMTQAELDREFGLADMFPAWVLQ